MCGSLVFVQFCVIKVNIRNNQGSVCVLFKIKTNKKQKFVGKYVKSRDKGHKSILGPSTKFLKEFFFAKQLNFPNYY